MENNIVLASGEDRNIYSIIEDQINLSTQIPSIIWKMVYYSKKD